MAKLAATDGVRLTDVRVESDYSRKANMPPETFLNRSFCIGGGEIVVGKYEDQERRLASFLHELGHVHTSGPDSYEAERRAWRWAFGRAKKLGLKFSGGTLEWCSDQLETHARNSAWPVWRKNRLPRWKSASDVISQRPMQTATGRKEKKAGRPYEKAARHPSVHSGPR